MSKAAATATACYISLIISGLEVSYAFMTSATSSSSYAALPARVAIFSSGLSSLLPPISNDY